MGNSKELCAWAQFFLESLASRRGSFCEKITIFQGFQAFPKLAVFLIENNDELRPHPLPPSLQWPLISVTVWVGVYFFFWRDWHPPPSPRILREWEWEWEFTGIGKHAPIPWPLANAIPRMAKGMTIAAADPLWDIFFFRGWQILNRFHQLSFQV
jgi:hypothetical protein